VRRKKQKIAGADFLYFGPGVKHTKTTTGAKEKKQLVPKHCLFSHRDSEKRKRGRKFVVVFSLTWTSNTYGWRNCCVVV